MSLATFTAAALANRSVSKFGGYNKWRDGGYLGECVSLINQYCYRVLKVPAGAWGHAVAWGYETNTFVRKYFGHAGGTPRRGDVLVYPGHFGHIEIYLGAGMSLYQNRGYNGRVGVGRMLKGYYRILRRKVTPAPVAKPQTRTYTVKDGDTVSAICQRFKITLQRFKALNPQVKNINYITVGQKVRVK